MSKCIVLGGGGFIGSHLVEALIADGHEIRVFDNFADGNIKNLPKSGWSMMDDFKDDWLKDAVVYHLAAKVDISWSEKYRFYAFDHDVSLTKDIFREATERGANRILFVSSTAVYARADRQEEDVTPLHPDTPYGAAKMTGEALALMVAKFGVPTLSIRPFNVYGPRQRIGGVDKPVVPSFIRSCLGDRPITIEGTGEQSLDFIFVKDAARWMAGLAGVDSSLLQGQAVNMGSGTSTKINKLADMCAGVIGYHPGVRYKPARNWSASRTEAVTTRMQELFPVEMTPLELGIEETAIYYSCHV